MRSEYQKHQSSILWKPKLITDTHLKYQGEKQGDLTGCAVDPDLLVVCVCSLFSVFSVYLCIIRNNRYLSGSARVCVCACVCVFLCVCVRVQICLALAAGPSIMSYRRKEAVPTEWRRNVPLSSDWTDPRTTPFRLTSSKFRFEDEAEPFR